MSKKYMKEKKEGISTEKRGQGLSVNAIILIVLGVIILVILILGFFLGWSTIFPFLSTNNVQTVVSNCDNACSTSAKYDFCTVEREVKDEKKNEVTGNCNLFANLDIFQNYGVARCTGLCENKPLCTEIKFKVGDKEFKGELFVGNGVLNSNDLLKVQGVKSGSVSYPTGVGNAVTLCNPQNYIDATELAKQGSKDASNNYITGGVYIDISTDALKNVYCCIPKPTLK